VRYNTVIVRPGEFMVRRGSPVRKLMLNRLKESIEKTLAKKGFPNASAKIVEPRLIVSNIDDPPRASEVIASTVFGVSSSSPALSVEAEIPSIIHAIEKNILRVKPRSLSLTVTGEIDGLKPREITWIIAGEIKKNLMVRFDLEKPDFSIGVDVRGSKAYIFDKIHRGIGGLPYGIEGCMVVLVSGGVDSAVASWLTMKRGIRIIPVYIDYGEYWPREALSRFNNMIKRLYELLPWDYLRYYRVKGMEKLVLEAKRKIPARLTCLFCKANMYRVAGYVAEEEGCTAISTGEAVGQVASQTLRNLSVLTRLSPLPILRPLAFYDKDEIVREARRLGFHDIMRRTDGCRLRPESPETGAGEKEYLILKKILEETEEDARKLFLEGRRVGVLP
jgi:thiamine biosynthesis protein ThiI